MSAGAAGPPGPLDVLCLGEALVDLVPAGPEGVGRPLAEVELFRRHPGGAPTNVAIGLARQGLRVGLLTAVGPDAFGDFLRGRLAAEGVDTGGLHVDPEARTGITFIAIGSAGERSFTSFRQRAADQRLAPAHVDRARVAAARVLHLGSSTLPVEPARAATLCALAAAEEAGRLVSYDPNWRAHLWADRAEGAALAAGLLGRAHLVKVADDELPTLLGLDDPVEGARALCARGCDLAVVTRGAAGCVWQSADGRTGASPGRRVAVVDTTGAGDAFVAGLLAALLAALPAGARPSALATDELERAMAAANALGAAACTALGATAGVPRRAAPPRAPGTRRPR